MVADSLYRDRRGECAFGGNIDGADLQQLDGSSDDALLSGRGDQRIRSGRKSSVFPRGDGLP